MTTAITLAQAQAQLSAWLDASLAVSKGQTVQMDGQSLTRADAWKIQEAIAFWDQKVQELTAAAANNAPVGRTYAKNGGGGRW